MSEDRALGRGLEELLSEIAGDRRSVPIGSLEPNPNQPRKTFEPEEIETLAESIRRYGILQPLLVAPLKEKPGLFQLIAGERRWRAARQAGLEQVPVTVVAAEEQRKMELALVENLQRRALGAIDRAHAYQALIDDFDMTQEQIAEAVGVSRPSVANTLRMLLLGSDAQAAISSGRITEGHGRALLAQPDPAAREQLLRRILGEGLSVRDSERAAKRKPKPAAANVSPTVSIQLEHIKTRLQRRLATRVRIVGSYERGYIQLPYKGSEDFDALVKMLLDEE